MAKEEKQALTIGSSASMPGGRASGRRGTDVRAAALWTTALVISMVPTHPWCAFAAGIVVSP
jgi:hypothetical protein